MGMVRQRLGADKIEWRDHEERAKSEVFLVKERGGETRGEGDS